MVGDLLGTAVLPVGSVPQPPSEKAAVTSLTAKTLGEMTVCTYRVFAANMLNPSDPDMLFPGSCLHTLRGEGARRSQTREGSQSM